jgi:hypothetical protein
MTTAARDFTQVLLARGVITRAQLEEARETAKRSGAHLEDVLVNLGHTPLRDVMLACAESLGLAFLDLTALTVPPAVLELVPESVARENVLLPVWVEGAVLVVAVSDPADLDTLQKLRFILNRDVRPVLAVRDQIVAAINRHYGETETESVDSMLAEFTDTAIDFTRTAPAKVAVAEADAEYEVGLPADSVVECPAPAAPVVARRATVRYYERMNPERLFPLLVVLSDGAVRAVSQRGVAQGESERFAVTEGSVVEVEPVLPGCTCYPPREQVRVGPGEVTATFWVAAAVLGAVRQARVVVRQNGRTLAEVPLRACVVRQRAAVLMGALSLVLPFVLLLLKHFHLDFESQLEDGFGLYARLAQWGMQSLSPELLAALLLAATAGLYLWLRPRKRDVFWDVDAIGAEGTSPADSAPVAAPADPEPVGQLEGPALLGEADRHFTAGDYAAALPLYERSLCPPAPAAVHFHRAALAAHHLGQTARAFAVLRRAERTLPAKAMKGPLWYNLGCFATRLGRFADAVGYLNRAVDAGYGDPVKYRSDPDLESLRWHAGFKRLLAGLSAAP